MSSADLNADNCFAAKAVAPYSVQTLISTAPHPKKGLPGYSQSTRKGNVSLMPSEATVGALLEELKPELPDPDGHTISVSVPGFTRLGNSGFVGGSFTVSVADKETVNTEIASELRKHVATIYNYETNQAENLTYDIVKVRPAFMKELIAVADLYREESRCLRDGDVVFVDEICVPTCKELFGMADQLEPTAEGSYTAMELFVRAAPVENVFPMHPLQWFSGLDQYNTAVKIHAEPKQDKELTVPLSIKLLTGKVFQVMVNNHDTIATLKENIQDQEGIPPDQQRLVHGGMQLEDGYTVQDYNLKETSIIHCVLRLRGGMMHESSFRNGFAELMATTIQIEVVRRCPYSGHVASDTMTVANSMSMNELKANIRKLPPPSAPTCAEAIAEAVPMAAAQVVGQADGVVNGGEATPRAPPPVEAGAAVAFARAGSDAREPAGCEGSSCEGGGKGKSTAALKEEIAAAQAHLEALQAQLEITEMNQSEEGAEQCEDAAAERC